MRFKERVGTFFQGRGLEKSIERIDRMLKRVEKSGTVTRTQLDFVEAQNRIPVPDDEEEYWDERVKEAFSDPSGDKLQEMVEQMSLADLTSMLGDLRQELQRRQDDLE